MLKRIVGNYPVKRCRRNLAKVWNRWDPEVLSCTASLWVDFNTKLSAAGHVSQEGSSTAAKIKNIKFWRKPWFELNPVGPASELPDWGVPIQVFPAVTIFL
jgi:hypothetical protein